MRNDELYLRDMLIAMHDISEFLADYDIRRFINDRVMRRAVLQAPTEIGEAANHVSSDVKDRYPEVPWDEARAFRNFAVHQHFAIDWEVVWATATSNIVELQPQIEDIIANEYSEESS